MTMSLPNILTGASQTNLFWNVEEFSGGSRAEAAKGKKMLVFSDSSTADKGQFGRG